jgi:hypothetical protein
MFMLKQHAEDLWTADHELKFPLGMSMPTRMTVLRVPDGSLVLVSPVPIDEALAAELGALGPVSHVLAPNQLHHLHLRAAHARYPDARLMAASGVDKKQPSLRFEPLEPERSPALRDVLFAQYIAGAPRISETVLYHRPSRSLIVTDLVFNIRQAPSWTAAMLLWMTGSLGKLAQSRVWNFNLETRALARESCQRIFDWDFERVIVAHGDVVPSEGKRHLASALTRTGPVSLPAAQTGAD